MSKRGGLFVVIGAFVLLGSGGGLVNSSESSFNLFDDRVLKEFGCGWL